MLHPKLTTHVTNCINDCNVDCDSNDDVDSDVPNDVVLLMPIVVVCLKSTQCHR